MKEKEKSRGKGKEHLQQSLVCVQLPGDWGQSNNTEQPRKSDGRPGESVVQTSARQKKDSKTRNHADFSHIE